ncbi:MAG: porin [Candidatus Nitrotoga sp.]
MNIKKSFIALAVAGAFVTPVTVMASDGMMHGPSNVTIYGQMNASIDSIKSDNGATVGTLESTANHLSSNESRIGFKGSEDMGGGLSAIWQIESQVNLDNDSAGLGNPNGDTPNGNTNTTAALGVGNRNTFVGLSSAQMGTVLAGRHDAPYKISTRMLDPFRFTLADNRSIMGHLLHDDFLGNVVGYVSPTMNGLSVAAGTVFGSEGAVPANPKETKSTTISLAGMYTMGGLYGTIAYQAVKLGTAAGTFGGGVGVNPDKLSALKIGGSYSMDISGMATKVSAIYEMLDHENVGGAAAADWEDINYYFAGELGVSSAIKVKAAYTIAANTKGVLLAGSSGATQFTVGADYGLSARTTVYALYTSLSNDTFAVRRAQLGPQSTARSVAGAFDATALSAGVRHMF